MLHKMVVTVVDSSNFDLVPNMILKTGTFYESYFPMKVTALTFESVDQIESVTIQIKANRSCSTFFPVVLFIMLYKVILTFKSVDEIVNRPFK